MRAHLVKVANSITATGTVGSTIYRQGEEYISIARALWEEDQYSVTPSRELRLRFQPSYGFRIIAVEQWAVKV